MVDYSAYKTDCVSFLQKLIQTPSVNGKNPEKDIVKVIADEAKKLGLSYKIIEKEKNRPNIFVGDSFTSNKNLLLVAHIDTVPEGNRDAWDHSPFSGKISDNKVYGRGAIDCKGGIAVSLYTLKALKDIGKADHAKFVGVADEESGADSDFGLRYVLSQGLKAKGAVYTYGNSKPPTHVIIGHRGLIRLWVTCIGESTHSGSSDWQNRKKGENAIDGIAEFVNELSKIKISATNKYFPGYKFVFTPTILEGGVGESIVPDKAKVLVDIRTLPDVPSGEIIKKIKLITRKLSKGKRKYEIEIKNNLPAVLTNPKESIVKSAQKLTKEIYGSQVGLKGSGPANESYMLITKNIPTITGYGPIGNGFHSSNEHAEISSIEKSLAFLSELALATNS